MWSDKKEALNKCRAGKAGCSGRRGITAAKIVAQQLYCRVIGVSCCGWYRWDKKFSFNIRGGYRQYGRPHGKQW